MKAEPVQVVVEDVSSSATSVWSRLGSLARGVNQVVGGVKDGVGSRVVGVAESAAAAWNDPGGTLDSAKGALASAGAGLGEWADNLVKDPRGTLGRTAMRGLDATAGEFARTAEAVSKAIIEGRPGDAGEVLGKAAFDAGVAKGLNKGVGALKVGFGGKPGTGVESAGAPNTKVDLSQTGSYTNTHASGATYSGKGGRARSQQSGRRQARAHDDPHVATDFTPADNAREAFKQESRRIDANGGVGDPSNFNQIESPDRRFRIDDGELLK